MENFIICAVMETLVLSGLVILNGPMQKIFP